MPTSEARGEGSGSAPGSVVRYRFSVSVEVVEERSDQDFGTETPAVRKKRVGEAKGSKQLPGLGKSDSLRLIKVLMSQDGLKLLFGSFLRIGDLRD